MRVPGADVLMASTAYGGSSELTDICNRAPCFAKHTFDITGRRDISAAIQAALGLLADPANAAELKPTTVLFVEIPTNPDMKVCVCVCMCVCVLCVCVCVVCV